MADLVTWLRAQLDEDERVARELHANHCGHDAVGAHAPCDCDWHVARILAEVDAKRRILDLHHIIWRDIGWLERDEDELYEMGAELPVCDHCVPRHSSFPTRAEVPEGACRTIRLLALPYADRPGYLEEWRP